MNDFFNILLLVASAYASFMLFFKAKGTNNSLYIIYGVAAICITVTFLGTPINILSSNFDFVFPYNAYMDWGRIVSLAALMSGLIEFIRQSKPEFARFPKFFVALPVLLVLSYPFIINTIVLKEWLIAIYEGGSLVVALLMHGIHSRKNKVHFIILSGLSLLLVTFILYWFTKSYIYDYNMFWQTGLFISIITIVSGFNRLETTGTNYALHDSE